MLIETAAVSVIVGFLKPVAASIYKAVRVALVSTREELAKQLGKVKIVERAIEVEGQTIKRNFEVGDEELITAWRRLSVFLHVLLTS